MEAFFRASSIICPVKKAYALLSAAALVAVPSTPNAASSCASTSNSSSFFFIILLHQFIGFFYFFSRGFLCLFLKTIKKDKFLCPGYQKTFCNDDDKLLYYVSCCKDIKKVHKLSNFCRQTWVT